MNLSLYLWQRSTAALMAPMVLVHLVVIFYATRHGLTAADILGRLRGSLGWGGFYALFVIAASIHAGIGIRNVLAEWSPLAERAAGIAAAVFGLMLCALGLRAVAAVALLTAPVGRIARRLDHRKDALWIAALVHRLSGLALAIFLPLHFLALGLAIGGEAKLDGFLRWSERRSSNSPRAGSCSCSPCISSAACASSRWRTSRGMTGRSISPWSPAQRRRLPHWRICLWCRRERHGDRSGCVPLRTSS